MKLLALITKVNCCVLNSEGNSALKKEVVIIFVEVQSRLASEGDHVILVFINFTEFDGERNCKG